MDYRLLPQVQLKDMVEDVLDAYQWIRANINTVAAPGFVDIDRIAVAGESAGQPSPSFKLTTRAGGTLVTLLGLLAKPAPKAVLNLYGVVDFTDPPFLHAPNHGAILPYSNRYTESELAAKLASPDPADVLSHCPIPPTDPRYGQLELPRGFEYTDRHWLQMDLKAYIYRHGGMVQEVFGFNDRPVEGERYAQLVKAAKEFSVLNLLAEATSFPPTYVVHGTEDAQVRVDQSDRFVKALEGKGVPVKYAREEGGIHGNDDAWDVSTCSKGEAYLARRQRRYPIGKSRFRPCSNSSISMSGLNFVSRCIYHQRPA